MTIDERTAQVKDLIQKREEIDAECPFRNFLNRLNQLGFK